MKNIKTTLFLAGIFLSLNAHAWDQAIFRGESYLTADGPIKVRLVRPNASGTGRDIVTTTGKVISQNEITQYLQPVRSTKYIVMTIEGGRNHPEISEITRVLTELQTPDGKTVGYELAARPGDKSVISSDLTMLPSTPKVSQELVSQESLPYFLHLAKPGTAFEMAWESHIALINDATSTRNTKALTNIEDALTSRPDWAQNAETYNNVKNVISYTTHMGGGATITETLEARMATTKTATLGLSIEDATAKATREGRSE